MWRPTTTAASPPGGVTAGGVAAGGVAPVAWVICCSSWASSVAEVGLGRRRRAATASRSASGRRQHRCRSAGRRSQVRAARPSAGSVFTTGSAFDTMPSRASRNWACERRCSKAIGVAGEPSDIDATAEYAAPWRRDGGVHRHGTSTTSEAAGPRSSSSRNESSWRWWWSASNASPGTRSTVLPRRPDCSGPMSSDVRVRVSSPSERRPVSRRPTRPPTRRSGSSRCRRRSAGTRHRRSPAHRRSASAIDHQPGPCAGGELWSGSGHAGCTGCAGRTRGRHERAGLRRPVHRGEVVEMEVVRLELDLDEPGEVGRHRGVASALRGGDAQLGVAVAVASFRPAARRRCCRRSRRSG